MIVPVMHGDGVTDEAFLVETLGLLYVRQLLAHSGAGKGPAIDVLSLSLGYYHETPGAFDDEPAFASVLRALAGSGVAVVAAAGNGGTNHEFYPAAFAVAAGSTCRSPASGPSTRTTRRCRSTPTPGRG